MKRLLPMLLLLACASSDGGFAEHEMVDCAEMGNAVSVQLVDAQFGGAPLGGVRDFAMPIEFKLEVSNNTDHHVVVRQIGVSTRDAAAAYRIDAGWTKVNEMIDEGKEHVFTVLASGRQTREFRRGESTTVEVQTTVTLEDGQTYRCAFGVPLPALPPSR